MKKTYLVFALFFSLVMHCFGLEPPSTTKQPADAIGDQLSARLRALGSFRAEYRAIAPDKAADITILFNAQRRYCLSRIAVGETSEGEVYTVLDFSHMHEKRGGFHMLVLRGAEGKRVAVSFRHLFERLDNPVGVFLFFAEQFRSQTTTDSRELSVQAGSPSLSLGLSEESLTLAMGISTRKDSLAASWLDREALTTAVKVVESPGAVQLLYEENHVISIDRKTGLLLRDSWPDPTRPGRREIVLTSHSALQRDLPYSSVIPAFDSIRIVEVPPTQLYEQVYVTFLTDLGRKLSTIEGLDEILNRHSVDITAAVRKAGRRMIRERAETTVDANHEATAKLVRLVLVPAYERYREDHPQKTKGLSFPEFLDSLLAEAEADPTGIVPPEAGEFTETLKKKCQVVIARLPKDAQEPLTKLYELSMPALVEGWILEFLSAMFEQAKSSDISGLNKEERVPHRPDADDGR